MMISDDEDFEIESIWQSNQYGNRSYMLIEATWRSKPNGD